ncbi:hypothetical protein NQ176_g6228 [Zarea fungicola]|uniref:Uncharacterized protein n=1 Tax=Zarea fungicola TaxID=93591 RepID=A0ACC1N4W4_9HYPO|nr:hypothetical protein NQ176_g6228 [Lecanicillium fungicola]
MDENIDDVELSRSDCRSWPSDDHDHGSAVSGINCLLVLLKQMLSVGGERLLVNGTETNSFVTQSLMDLSDPFQASNALNLLAMETWRQPLGDIPMAELAISKVVCCAAMRETFWSKLVCHPWQTPLWSRSNDTWHSPFDKSTPLSVMDALGHEILLHMTPETFRLQAYPGMKLEEQINGRFGYMGSGEIQIIRPALPATFFYATFEVSNVTQSDKLSFDEFRTFQLEVVNPARRTTMRVRYNLSAIVKHRADVGDADSIRVYRGDGRPESPALPGSRYANPEWKIADMKDGDVFFVMYGMNYFVPELNPSFPETSAEIPPDSFNCYHGTFMASTLREELDKIQYSPGEEWD